jgi:integrase
MNPALRTILEEFRASKTSVSPDDLVFQTPRSTPLNSHNLYNRELAPACDRIAQPRVSWHSFRHTHATLLSEVGESLKTAQALLGHSDLETTLAVYTHTVPETQRRAVARVAGVLFSDVLNSASLQNLSGHVN